MYITTGPVLHGSGVRIGGEYLYGLLIGLHTCDVNDQGLFWEIFFCCESVLRQPEGFTHSEVILIRFFSFRNFVNPVVRWEYMQSFLKYSPLVL
jgi:hypothetical protein